MSKGRQVLLASLFGSLYFFLILMAYYILKPLRDSSLLSEFHPNMKPLLNTFTVFILVILASFYSTILKNIKGSKFIKYYYLILISNLLIFRLLFLLFPQFSSILFYIWLNCANVFFITIFWTQVNSSFIRSIDRFYYIVIALGGTLGGAIGGKVTALLVPYIGTDNLIFPAAFVFFLAFLCSQLMAKLTKQESFNIPKKEHSNANLRGLIKENYALCIFALVAIGTFIQAIFDYQLAVFVKNTYVNQKDILSIFYGNLYFKLNFYAIFAELILAPIILSTIGAAYGMFFLVFLIFGSSLALHLDPSLFVMEWVFILYAGSSLSIIQIFREQLYIPASDIIKVSYKGFIDTIGFRLGDGIAAIVIFVLIILIGADYKHFNWIIIGTGVITTFIIIKTIQLYKKIQNSGAA